MNGSQVAFDLSYEVLQLRRSRGELVTPPLDSQNCKLHGIPSQAVERHAFAADRESVRDSYQGEAIKFWPVEGK